MNEHLKEAERLAKEAKGNKLSNSDRIALAQVYAALGVAAELEKTGEAFEKTASELNNFGKEFDRVRRAISPRTP